MNTDIRKRNLIVLGFVAVVALAALGLWRSGYVQALDRLQRQGESDLALASDRLTAQLQRYRELAVFMAEHPATRAVLEGGGADPAMALFQDVADKTSALDVMLVDYSGRVRASAHGAEGMDLGNWPYVARCRGHWARGTAWAPRLRGGPITTRRRFLAKPRGG